MMDSEASTQQRLPEYIGPKVEDTLSSLNHALWVIPISLAMIYLFSAVILFIGGSIGIGSLDILTVIMKVAPIAVVFYYFLRLLGYLRQNQLSLSAKDRADILVPVPYSEREWRVSTRTCIAIFQGYVSGLLGIIWIKAVTTWQHGPGKTHTSRVKYIYNHVDWLNQSLSVILDLLLPSPITETGWEVLAILGVLLFVFIITRTVIIMTEELMRRFKKDSRERLFGILTVHFYLLIELAQQWKLVVKTSFALGVNYYLYKFILWFTAHSICLDENQGLAAFKCLGV